MAYAYQINELRASQCQWHFPYAVAINDNRTDRPSVSNTRIEWSPGRSRESEWTGEGRKGAAATSTESRKFRCCRRKTGNQQRQRGKKGVGNFQLATGCSTTMQTMPQMHKIRLVVWPESQTHTHIQRQQQQQQRRPGLGIAMPRAQRQRRGASGTPFDIIKSARRLRN